MTYTQADLTKARLEGRAVERLFIIKLLEKNKATFSNKALEVLEPGLDLAVLIIKKEN